MYLQNIKNVSQPNKSNRVFSCESMYLIKTGFLNCLFSLRCWRNASTRESTLNPLVYLKNSIYSRCFFSRQLICILNVTRPVIVQLLIYSSQDFHIFISFVWVEHVVHYMMLMHLWSLHLSIKIILNQ